MKPCFERLYVYISILPSESRNARVRCETARVECGIITKASHFVSVTTTGVSLVGLLVAGESAAAIDAHALPRLGWASLVSWYQSLPYSTLPSYRSHTTLTSHATGKPTHSLTQP